MNKKWLFIKVSTNCLKQIILLIILLIVFDAAILLNIPYFRQIMSVVFISLAPGVLILMCLDTGAISFNKKFVFCVGLSIIFLILVGLFNHMFVFWRHSFQPLSLPALLVSINVFLVMFAGICLIKKKNMLEQERVIQIKLSFTEILVAIITAIFPLIIVISISYMNVLNENKLLLLALASLPPALIVLCRMRGMISGKAWPFIIYMLSLGIVIMGPLRGEYLILSGDADFEYLLFNITSTAQAWLSHYGNPINSCLSVGLIHTIYQNLLGTSVEWTYKYLSPLLISIVPLIIYEISIISLAAFEAFLCAMFFMVSWWNFVFSLNYARGLLGILCISLIVLSMHGKELKPFERRLLTIIFMIGLVLSYYTFSYIFFIILLCGYLISPVLSYFNRLSRGCKTISISFLLLTLVFIFIWQAQVNAYNFKNVVDFLKYSIQSMAKIFLFEAREDSLFQEATGQRLSGPADLINILVYYATLGMIAFGSLYSIWRRKFTMDYLSLIMACLFIWLAIIVTPFIAYGFGIERGYFPTLVILTPAFIVGCSAIGRSMGAIFGKLTNHKLIISQWGIVLAISIISLQLAVNTGLTYQLFGHPRSVLLNSNGLQYNTWYIHKEESAAAQWLIQNKSEYSAINGDAYMGLRVTAANMDISQRINNALFRDDPVKEDGYIFLRYQNVVNKTVIPWYVRKVEDPNIPVSEFEELLKNKNKLYTNSGSEILSYGL